MRHQGITLPFLIVAISKGVANIQLTFAGANFANNERLLMKEAHMKEPLSKKDI